MSEGDEASFVENGKQGALNLWHSLKLKPGG
jgi:hypothetical protein